MQLFLSLSVRHLPGAQHFPSLLQVRLVSHLAWGVKVSPGECPALAFSPLSLREPPTVSSRPLCPCWLTLSWCSLCLQLNGPCCALGGVLVRC